MLLFQTIYESSPDLLYCAYYWGRFYMTIITIVYITVDAAVERTSTVSENKYDTPKTDINFISQDQ